MNLIFGDWIKLDYILIFLFISTDLAMAVKFQQSSSIIANQSIKCHHDDSGMNVMLWYKQLHDGQMKLIVYSHIGADPDFEKDFKKRFAMRRTDIQTGALIISNVEPNDSATYFCAASTQ
uniref:Ig-like domain-containing protein n=1 Tax=Periophthalmus magnuspinnatus TaxID=409849 RepID=A0A3B4ARY8_9GOBI